MDQGISNNRRPGFSILLFAALMMAFGGCTFEPTQKKNAEVLADIDRDIERVKSTLLDMWDAIERGDIDRYARHIHPDFTQFGENDSVLRIGKEAEVEAIASWISNSAGIHTEMERPRISMRGDVAWIVYYWKDRGVTGGEPFNSQGKSTRIFVKEKDRWLCIHGHYTLLP